jgi:hypothetical protein
MAATPISFYKDLVSEMKSQGLVFPYYLAKDLGCISAITSYEYYASMI